MTSCKRKKANNIFLCSFLQVEEYYQHIELKEGKLPVKKVYVATDDSKVLGECRKKYPDYEFLGDQKASKTAAVSTRYSSNSLKVDRVKEWQIIKEKNCFTLQFFLVLYKD